ncbi:MAG: ArsR family transcriptional regulator [Motilibacteraceae bacterium]
MRTPPPALLPLLRSQVQGDLLALLLLSPEREFSLTEIAERIDVSVKAVSVEATRLAVAGLIRERRVGNTRQLSAEPDNPQTRPLTELLALTYGPLPLLREALETVPGIKRAYLYGSWAARYQGQEGPPPNDIDVLVVGDHVDQEMLYARVDQVASRLRREVNLRRVGTARWQNPDSDPFLATVVSRPLVALIDEHPPHGERS